MTIDHIFIFTDEKGNAADQLVEFGFTEGSSRVHTGQVTTNRKFYFYNFFLEVLWVHNEEEIRGELLKNTGLWERANYKANTYSPYGLCVVNDDPSEALFTNSVKYQPAYFPEGMAIDIVKNERQPQLPWTFRLPFKGQKKFNHTEPLVHKNAIRELTKAQFNFNGSGSDSYLDYFKHGGAIEFIQSNGYGLTLTFDNNSQGRKEYFPDLKLTIEY